MSNTKRSWQIFNAPRPDDRAIDGIAQCVDPIRRSHPALTLQSRVPNAMPSIPTRMSSMATPNQSGSEGSEPHADARAIDGVAECADGVAGSIRL